MIGRWRSKRHVDGPAGRIVVDGARKRTGGRAKTRVVMTMAAFLGIYGVIAGRLVYLGMLDPNDSGGPASRVTASRPDIVDRNGEVLATDIKTASLFAEPRRIVDADEAIERLSTVLPDIDYEQTYAKLKSGAGFVWLRRQLSPKQQNDIIRLGIPGIGFRTEKKRFYPGGPTASHVLGLVNVDNQGIAGIEKYIDEQGLADLQASGLAIPTDLKPFRLSLDIRVQHIVHDELARAMEKYHAIAAGAVVLNVKTGEVLAMASLPDYDPNNPYNAQEKDRLNRMSAGTFEMGSTIKSFTTAMALDSGKVTLEFDLRRPSADHHRTPDHPRLPWQGAHPDGPRGLHLLLQHRLRTRGRRRRHRGPPRVPEAHRPPGPAGHRAAGSRPPDRAESLEEGALDHHRLRPRHVHHPLQTAVGAAALMNGGRLIPPTFLPRSPTEADRVATQVVKAQTSADMRYLYRLNAEKGSGKKAEVPGFRVGGKTGTAEKVVNGRYASDKRFNAFLASFPMDDPQYVVLSVIDEPKPEKPGMGATAASNAAPIVANVIRRSASLLGVKPEFSHENEATLVSYQ